MPMSIAALTPRAIRIAINAIVASESSTGGDVSRPSVTSVPGAATMMPLHSRPMRAMSRPMPTLIACFSEVGTAVITRSRKPIPAVRMKIVPAIATAPRAMGHGVPPTTTTVNAKKKLCPIAGATAMG